MEAGGQGNSFGSGFEELIADLRSLGLEPRLEVQRRGAMGSNHWASTLSYVMVPLEDCFFVAYYDYFHASKQSLTFTGIFAAVDGARDFKCEIYEKTWLFDLLFRRRKRFVGTKAVDGRLSIVASGELPSGLLKDEDVTGFISLQKAIGGMKILVEDNYLYFAEPFHDRKVVGIRTAKWLTDINELKLFIGTGAPIVGNMKKILDSV